MGVNWIWFGLTLVVLLVDVFTSSFTYSWLAIGFIPAFILGFFYGVEVQLPAAIIIGGISLLFGIKISKKYIKKNIKPEKLLLGKFEGKQFTAEEDIEKEGRMKVSEVYWNVKNIGDPVKKGDVFTVMQIAGNSLIIKKER